MINKSWWILALLIGTLIIVGLVITVNVQLSIVKYIQIPLHSTIETIGGIAAILTSFALFNQCHCNIDRIEFFIATGFASMGILDTFHATCMPGDPFIFLHSAASLAGGFFFMLTWLPQSTFNRYVSEQRWFVLTVIIVTISIGLRAILFPEAVPKIIHLYDNRFTEVANVLNTIASLFFLCATPQLFIAYRKTKKQTYFLFLCLAFLFGSAEMAFQYSDIWNGVWWVWHIIRFLAYLLTLFCIVRRYTTIIGKLEKTH